MLPLNHYSMPLILVEYYYLFHMRKLFVRLFLPYSLEMYSSPEVQAIFEVNINAIFYCSTF